MDKVLRKGDGEHHERLPQSEHIARMACSTKVCLVELFSKHLGPGKDIPSGMQRQ